MGGGGADLVRVVRDVDELIDRRRVDLLVLCRDEHAGDPHELQFAPVDGHLREKAVNVVDGQIERLGLEPVLLGNLDEPIDEDAAHGRVDVALALHVVRRHAVLHLERSQVRVDLLRVVVAELRVALRERVELEARDVRGLDCHRLAAARLLLLRRLLLLLQEALPRRPLARHTHIGRHRHGRDSGS